MKFKLPIVTKYKKVNSPIKNQLRFVTVFVQFGKILFINQYISDNE